ncbi:MAG: DNA primase [Acidobacteria bacterium]|nr:DNA primase [Acidobacteriota bacterium]|tara:strand:- start:466 stop:2229 length:1764 start_codon:yes stop_codon:yes gene_type:complete
MGLFPQSFIEDLKVQADIVQVVQDYLPLKKVGNSYKGLCPFHSEKTPSFHVHRDKAFFHCFGCGAGGDVLKFLELQEKLGFQDAVQHLAQRFGIQVPEPDTEHDPAADAERETMLRLHELATDFFQNHLVDTDGVVAREHLTARGITGETIALLQLGFAPPARDGLVKHLRAKGYSDELLVRSGLATSSEGRPLADRFRNRLVIPISREGGSVIAFGARALHPNQQPKYLNSPETNIYSKANTLYGLNLSKRAIRQAGYVVMVEGYFDLAQVVQAGLSAVVACCGTAVTEQQVRLLKRFSSKVILSFDPDPAGAEASARSGELLLSEGFQVNVASLSQNEDPDSCIRKHGITGYSEKLRTSLPYLEYLLDRESTQRDLSRGDHQREFLTKMLQIAARIPDAAARDQFADRLAHKAKILEDVVRMEIRKAAVDRRTSLDEQRVPTEKRIKAAENGLIWAVVHETSAALSAISSLTDEDLEGLATAPILRTVRSLADWPADIVLDTLQERLSNEESEWVARVGTQDRPPAPTADCGQEIKRLGYERQRAAVQEEIDRCQQIGTPAALAEIDLLWQKKRDLLTRLESLHS